MDGKISSRFLENQPRLKTKQAHNRCQETNRRNETMIICDHYGVVW